MSTTNEIPNDDGSEISGNRKSVKLPGLSERLGGRVERRISEYEDTNEPAIFNGNGGIIPRIEQRDYLIEACVGIVLTLYFFIELFVV